jgi:quercetin dioxygenase-like cupin family protein
MMWSLLLASALIVGQSRQLDASMSDPQIAVPHKASIAHGEGRDWTVVSVELSPGAADSWQSRTREEFLFVLEGTGRLEDGEKPAIVLKPGTVATLTSVPRHVLKNTSRTRTLKVLVVYRAEERQLHPLLGRMGQESQGSKEPNSNGRSGQRKNEKQQESRDIGLIF